MVHPRIPVLQHKLLDRVFSFVCHLSSTNHYALMRHAARWIVNAVKKFGEKMTIVPMPII